MPTIQEIRERERESIAPTISKNPRNPTDPRNLRDMPNSSRSRRLQKMVGMRENKQR